MRVCKTPSAFDQAGVHLRGLRLASEAQAALLQHAWPGNVRELEHLIGRAAIKALARHGERPRILSLDVQDLDLPVSETSAAVETVLAPDEPVPAGVELRTAVDAFQRQLIEQCLARHQGKWADAARELGVDRANLSRLAKRLGIR